MLQKWSCFLAIMGGCLLMVAPPSHAQVEKKVQKTDEEVQQERMQKLMTAYNLAEQGRTKKAPEYLITAAGMLLHLSPIKDLDKMKPYDIKPEITGAGK